MFIKRKVAYLIFFKFKKIIHLFFIKDSDRKSYDLISWFRNFYFKQGVSIENINHENKSITNIAYGNFEISYCEPPFFFIKDIFKILKFFYFLSFTLLFFYFSENVRQLCY